VLQRVMPDSGRGAGAGEDRKTNNLPFFEVKIISTGLARSRARLLALENAHVFRLYCLGVGVTDWDNILCVVSIIGWQIQIAGGDCV